ncbi:MAG TPA: hypothetical protein VMC62_11725 [Longilinea sp.]|nr:hypothetical protein [Longilinea sp.]
MGKLIIVACGAGINTSTMAEDAIRERLLEEGMGDVTVKRILMADIEKYIGQMDILVSMMKVFRDFGIPTFQGMPFLIGSKEEKNALLEKIIEAVKR